MEIVITEVLSAHLYYFIPIFITLTDVHLDTCLLKENDCFLLLNISVEIQSNTFNVECTNGINCENNRIHWKMNLVEYTF